MNGFLAWIQYLEEGGGSPVTSEKEATFHQAYLGVIVPVLEIRKILR